MGAVALPLLCRCSAVALPLLCPCLSCCRGPPSPSWSRRRIIRSAVGARQATRARSVASHARAQRTQPSWTEPC